MPGSDDADAAAWMQACNYHAKHAAIHPRTVFSKRILGPINTLSATFDTVSPFSFPRRALLLPHGVMAEHSTLAVCDSGNSRIQLLTPAGDLKCEFSLPAACSIDGQTVVPSEIARHAGLLLVAAATSTRDVRLRPVVAIFDVNGNYPEYSRAVLGCLERSPCGIAVSRRGCLYVCDPSDHDREEPVGMQVAYISKTIGVTDISDGGCDDIILRQARLWDTADAIAVAVDDDEVFVLCASGHVRVFSDAAVTPESLLANEILHPLRSWTAPEFGRAAAGNLEDGGIAVMGGRVYVALRDRLFAFLRGKESNEAATAVLRLPGRPGRLGHISAGVDGRLLVSDLRNHVVHFVVPLSARVHRWRLIVRCISALLASLRRATHRLFAPGGIGFEQARISFTEHAEEQQRAE